VLTLPNLSDIYVVYVLCVVELTQTVDPKTTDICVIPPFPFLRDVYKVFIYCMHTCMHTYMQ
jgi:hypothetical protein